jgi:protease-4
MVMRTNLFIILVATAFFANGCAAPKLKLFSDATDPLQEFTLQGIEKGKVLVIPIRGIISDAPRNWFPGARPSMVQEIVSQLRLAEKGEEVRTILLKIDSPGGSITATDVLYQEIMAFKKRTGVKVVVAMMDVAASGSYYISLPADFILAHPTTVTGSVGAMFMWPQLTGVMEKIGLDVKVAKSGQNKDMGSPFRQTTEEEEKILQELTDELGRRFVSLVAKHRKLDQKALADISTGRVYIANEALQLGLVDKIGYLSDAVGKAKKLSGLSEDTKIVVYRRTEYPDDNLYNTATTQYSGSKLALIELGLPESMTSLRTGFYYLWLPGSGSD